MSGEMACAYFISHAPRGFFPILNGGDGAILYCFIFLYFAFAGAGTVEPGRDLAKEGLRPARPKRGDWLRIAHRQV